MDEFEFDGYWFVPEDTRNRVPGRLTFDPVQGLTLELYSPFEDYLTMEDERVKLDDIGTIFGDTNFGGKITLVNCQSQGYRSFPDKNHEDWHYLSSYEPDYAYIGEHADGGPLFTSITAGFSHFPNWVHHTDIEQFDIELTDGTEFKFHYTGMDDPTRSPGSLDGEFLVSFLPEDDFQAEDFISRYVWPLQQFVTLGLFCPIFITRLYGGTTGREPLERNASGFKVINGQRTYRFPENKTSVVFSNRQRRLRPGLKRPFGYYTMANFTNSSRRSLNEILPQWYEAYWKHMPLFDLYFNSVWYDDQPYPSVTLLNLTRALESYHRESDNFSNHYIPPDEFEQYQETLIDSIPDDFPEDLKSHLEGGTFKFANRLTLERRFRDIIKYHEEYLKQILGENLDPKEMSNKVRKVRNELTHLSDDDLSEYDEQAKGTLNRQLGLLVELSMADEAGIPLDVILLTFGIKSEGSEA